MFSFISRHRKNNDDATFFDSSEHSALYRSISQRIHEAYQSINEKIPRGLTEQLDVFHKKNSLDQIHCLLNRYAYCILSQYCTEEQRLLLKRSYFVCEKEFEDTFYAKKSGLIDPYDDSYSGSYSGSDTSDNDPFDDDDSFELYGGLNDNRLDRSPTHDRMTGKLRVVSNTGINRNLFPDSTPKPSAPPIEASTEEIRRFYSALLELSTLYSFPDEYFQNIPLDANEEAGVVNNSLKSILVDIAKDLLSRVTLPDQHLMELANYVCAVRANTFIRKFVHYKSEEAGKLLKTLDHWYNDLKMQFPNHMSALVRKNDQYAKYVREHERVSRYLYAHACCSIIGEHTALKNQLQPYLLQKGIDPDTTLEVIDSNLRALYSSETETIVSYSSQLNYLKEVCEQQVRGDDYLLSKYSDLYYYGTRIFSQLFTEMLERFGFGSDGSIPPGMYPSLD